MTTSVFKSPEARERFRAVYNGILSSLPFERRYVDTSFGPTFLLQAGAPEKPPVVVLHGSCSNSVFMTQELLGLSDNHAVFAPDIIGEAGNSGDRRPDLKSGGYALWLREVFSALGLPSAALVGNSLGGWLALQFAATYPELVTSLALIAPGGLSGQHEETLRKAVAMIRDPSSNQSPTMDAAIIGEAALPKEVIDFMNLILEVYTPITEVLPTCTDAQLKRLTMPVLFVGGVNDAILNMRDAARRLEAVLPHADVRLLEGTGHIILNAVDYIRPFLEKGAAHDSITP